LIVREGVGGSVYGILMEVGNLQAPSSHAASAPSVSQIIQ
jgi:hypothetical protein